MSNLACNRDVTRAIAVLLSQTAVQQDLIHEDLVMAFFEVADWENKNMDDDEVANWKPTKGMSETQQSLLKSVYDVSALREFAAKYAKEDQCPKLVNDCIATLEDLSNLQQEEKAMNTIQIASACIVLANLTRSKGFALFLVQDRKVHLSLGVILRQLQNMTTLFPTLALLDRLSIPPENKFAIAASGIIHELPRFIVEFDVQPRIQREAISVMRKVMIGQAEYVSAIGVCIPANIEGCPHEQEFERAQEQSGLLAAFNLFRRSSDVETRIEIGRLIVEACRSLLHSPKGHIKKAANAFYQTFGRVNEVASPISYLACNGASRDVRGEGWFGLAILSTWEHGRPLVIDCLADEAVQKKMEEDLKEGERAFCQNISLILTKLHSFPSHLVLASTRDFLERAANSAGLPRIWPVVMALAA
jgi:hypothetical protein